MSLIEDELGKSFKGRVKFKRFKEKSPSHYRSIARLVISKAPETMVKITGFSSGGKHIAAHLKYISRDTDLPLENDRGEIFIDKKEIEGVINDWVEDINSFKGRKKSRDAMHLMLSMQKGTNPQAVHDAVRDFARKQFGHNHEYLFALHTDTPHPHVHIAVKMQGFDATRLNPRKADLQEWREEFAVELRNQGVEAVATPRKSRGVVKKSEKAAIYRLNRIDKTHKKRVAKVTALQIKENTLEIINEKRGGKPKQKPWEDKIKKTQGEVRESYSEAIKILSSSNIKEDRKLAKELRGYLETMAKELVTQNHEMKQKIYDDIKASRKKDKKVSKKVEKDIER